MPDNFTDKLDEINGQAAAANAFLQMALRPDDIAESIKGGLLTGIDSCVAKIVLSVPGITSWGLEDSNTSKAVTNAMSGLVMEIGNVFQELFVPVDFDFDPDSLAGSISSYQSAILSSLSDPFAAMVATQQNVLTSSLEGFQNILYSDTEGSKGVINQYQEKLETIIKSLFLNNPDLGIAGLVGYAITEGIPAIQSEQFYLRRMKRSIREGIEKVSRLPKQLDVALPNASAANQLCEAEKWLRVVEDKLTRINVFDRKAFGNATEKVCKTKNDIYDGKLDKDFLAYHAGNLSGISAADLKTMGLSSFLPDIRLRLSLVELQNYTVAFQNADVQTQTLYNNFLLIIDTIEKLAETRLGDIMAILVSILRLQISGVRADLESQGQGFSGYEDAQTGGNQQRNDIYAYLSSQATAYVILSAICTIMQKSNGIYSTLDKVLAGESRVVKFLQDFIGKLKTKCPGAQGGDEIIATVQAYEKAIQDRINGGSTSNQQVIAAGQIAIRRIEEYERFLACFKSELFFGNKALETIVSSIGTALATYQTLKALITQIKMIIRLYPQMKAVYKNLDLAKLLGIDAASYNALDTIVAGLQCLVLQCDNPAISSLASLAAQQFQDQFAKKRSEAITMGSLDELPKTGLLSILTKRVQAILRLMQLIQQITNANLNDLCAIKTPANSPLVLPTALFSGANTEVLVTDTSPWRKQQPQSLGSA